MAPLRLVFCERSGLTENCTKLMRDHIEGSSVNDWRLCNALNATSAFVPLAQGHLSKSRESAALRLAAVVAMLFTFCALS